MEDLIYTICPMETPFLNYFSVAEKTVIRFSGKDEKVVKWFKGMHKRRPKIIHEWIMDSLLPNTKKSEANK
jgi:hypothetical protein